MVAKTPLYGLPYIEPTDKPKDIAAQEKEAMLRIEQILASQGRPPLASELVDLVKRINSLENNPPATWEEFGGVNGAIPAGAKILSYRGATTLTKNSAGVASFVYPKAFPNQVLGIQTATIQYAAVPAVVDSGNITKSAANLVWVGAGAGPVKFSWMLWGY